MNKIIVVVVSIFLSVGCLALEKKSYEDILITDITADTQSTSDNGGDKNMSIAWWVPFEYWASVLSRDKNISDSIKNEMLSTLKKYTVIAVVQTDISTFGTFDFYSKKQVLETFKVSYENSNHEELKLLPEKNVSGDMKLLMSQISPVLKAAMGNLGENFYFFIYSDLNQNGERIIDPYLEGMLTIDLSNKEGKDLRMEFKMPLNSLYEPRLCPNGEKAHISWNYCPWSGKEI